MVRILVTQLAVPFVSTFVFLLNFVVICDLLKTEQTTWPTWREGLNLFLGISLFKRCYLWHVNAVFDLNNFLLHEVGLECQYYAFNFSLGQTLFTISNPPPPSMALLWKYFWRGGHNFELVDTILKEKKQKIN